MSAAIAFTEKGDEMLQRCNCHLESLELDIVAEGQMKCMPFMSPLYHKICNTLKDSNSSILDVYAILKAHRVKERLRNPLQSAKNLIKRIFKR